MGKFKTKQESYWAGAFGNQYIGRNDESKLLSSDVMLFSKILDRTAGVRTVLEFGANIGLNLRAIKSLLPEAEVGAIEINPNAVKKLRALFGKRNIFHGSILDFEPDFQRDFVFSKGVLIHINPRFLPAVYDKLYASSRRYVCIAEYHNPSPVEVKYRGHQDLLFKRDFAGELLERFPDLKLSDYGFAYRRDNNYAGYYDDLTWFLLEKKNSA